MRASGRNGPRSRPGAIVTNVPKEDRFSTPNKQRRLPSVAELPAQLVVEKKRSDAKEEDDAESDSEGAWSRRESARRRQIMIGKARPEYQRYIAEVPIESRGESQPSTPDPCERVSKRQFDRALGLWRRHLHEFDAVVGDTMAETQSLSIADSPISDAGTSARGRGGKGSTPPKSAAHSDQRLGDRNERTRVHTRRYSDSTGGADEVFGPVGKLGSASSAPSKQGVVSISLADELKMSDNDPPPMPQPSAAVYDAAMCNAMWSWSYSMPPPVDECSGWMTDPITPPKTNGLGEVSADMQSLFDVGRLTPDDKARRPDRQCLVDNFAFMPSMACFQPDDAMKTAACGANLQQMPQMPEQMDSFFSQAACQQQLAYAVPDPCQQQMSVDAWQWPMGANLEASSAATAAMSAPVVPEVAPAEEEPVVPTSPTRLEELPEPPPLPGTPSTPRRGASRSMGFSCGGSQFLSPGRSPMPSGWALETPSPEHLYGQLNKQQENHSMPGLFGQGGFDFSFFVPQLSQVAEQAAATDSSWMAQSTLGTQQVIPFPSIPEAKEGGCSPTGGDAMVERSFALA